MDQNYIEYSLPSNLSRWHNRWFYIGNHQPGLPERNDVTPKWTVEWTQHPDATELDQVLELVKRIKARCLCGVLLDHEADPATAEERDFWIWVPWNWRSISTICRGTAGRRSIEASTACPAGCTRCTICPAAVQCRESSQTGTSKLQALVFTEYFIFVNWKQLGALAKERDGELNTFKNLTYSSNSFAQNLN